MILKEFGYTELPINFDKEKHMYELDGIPMVGVSSAKNMKHREFMTHWPIKEMYLFLASKWNVRGKYTRAEKLALLMEGKKAWRGKSKTAMAIGTTVHELIEKSIISGERYDPDVLHQLECKEVSNGYKAFLAWEKAHKVEYLAVELIVGSREHYIGGTIDVVAIVDGKFGILDWKTSSMLSNAEFLQTAPYRMMLHEGGITDYVERRIVRLDKLTGEFEEYVITHDYNKDIEAFLCLLKVYRWDRDVNKKFADWNGKLKIN